MIRLQPLNLYAHFLDRELRQSVDSRLSSDDLVGNLLLAFLVSPGAIYCSYSHLWESAIYRSTTARLLDAHALIPVSDHASGIEFLESRRELYGHDKVRYPHYFDLRMTADIKSTQPVVIAKGERTTTILAANLGSWSGIHAGGADAESRAKAIVASSLLSRKGEAITHALFRKDAPDDDAALRIIRRQISLNYLSRYLKTCMADVATGLSGLEYYDSLAVKFPVFDMPLLQMFLRHVWRSHLMDLGELHVLKGLLVARIGPEAYAFRENWFSLTETIHAGIAKPTDSIHTVRTLMLNELGGLLSGLPQRRAISFSAMAEAATDLNHRASLRFGPAIGQPETDKRVLLVIATDVEQDRLLQLIQQRTPVETHTGYMVPLWTAKLGDRDIYVTRCTMGPLGVSGSINAARTAIEVVQPHFCIMPGICMGLKEDECKIGDLLVAEQVTDCETGKITQTNFLHRGKSLPGDPMLVSAARMANSQVSVHFGEMLSSTKVVNNKEHVESLRETYPNAFGLEMEGYGVASACYAVGKPFLLAKSICDWGYKKSDDHQIHSADLAMEFALALIKNVH